jgi:hypothetical protein
MQSKNVQACIDKVNIGMHNVIMRSFHNVWLSCSKTIQRMPPSDDNSSRGSPKPLCGGWFLQPCKMALGHDETNQLN